MRGYTRQDYEGAALDLGHVLGRLIVSAVVPVPLSPSSWLGVLFLLGATAALATFFWIAGELIQAGVPFEALCFTVVSVVFLVAGRPHRHTALGLTQESKQPRQQSAVGPS